MSKELEFIQTLGEARMFKTRDQISREGARVLTDHLFVSALSLFVMSKDYDYAPTAQAYAARTAQYGAFNKPSPGGTDLYQTIYSLQHPDFLKSQKDKLLMNRVNIDGSKITKFVKQMRSGNLTQQQAKTFLFKLEKDLAIQDPKLRAARRLIQDWDRLNTTQQQLAASQLTRHFKLNAKRSDLAPTFNRYVKDKGLGISSAKKGSIGKSIARKVGAFAGGYALGKATPL